MKKHLYFVIKSRKDIKFSVFIMRPLSFLAVFNLYSGQHFNL